MKRVRFPGFLGKYCKQLLFLIVVVIAWTALSPLLRGGTGEAELDYLDDRMVIAVSGSDRADAIEVPYASILSVETVYGLDLGEMVQGEQSRNLWCGTWKNDVYGEYFLEIQPKHDVYCVITGTDRVYVLNLRTKADTESFTDALRRLLEDKGYPPAIV